MDRGSYPEVQGASPKEFIQRNRSSFSAYFVVVDPARPSDALKSCFQEHEMRWAGAGPHHPRPSFCRLRPRLSSPTHGADPNAQSEIKPGPQTSRRRSGKIAGVHDMGVMWLESGARPGPGSSLSLSPHWVSHRVRHRSPRLQFNPTARFLWTNRKRSAICGFGWIRSTSLPQILLTTGRSTRSSSPRHRSHSRQTRCSWRSSSRLRTSPITPGPVTPMPCRSLVNHDSHTSRSFGTAPVDASRTDPVSRAERGRSRSRADSQRRVGSSTGFRWDSGCACSSAGMGQTWEQLELVVRQPFRGRGCPLFQTRLA
jgi:hypothetical protein